MFKELAFGPSNGKLVKYYTSSIYLLLNFTI